MNHSQSPLPSVAATLDISDLAAASFMLSIGGKLVGVLRAERGRLVFRFAGTTEDTLLRFYRGKDLVSARALFAAYRDRNGRVAGAM